MGHAPLAAPSTSCGSQIGLHLPEMQRSPAAQESAPLFTVDVASLHAAPSSVAPAGAQSMWPISFLVAVPSMSTTQVHFSPAMQPLWATGSQAIGASAPPSMSFTLPLPHAATTPTN